VSDASDPALKPDGTRRAARAHATDAATFIAANLPLAVVPSLPGILIHTARPDSGLRRLASATGAGPPPYWAYAWAGGIALARHVLELPGTVEGRRVLDYGSGSGLVAIAAARAGARSVVAAEIDPHGAAAIALNAAANGVGVTVLSRDFADLPIPDVDLVLAGDVFYDRRTARRSTRFLDRCLASGIEVIVGDPGRAELPRTRLRPVARYELVADVASGGSAGGAEVFAFLPDPGRPSARRT
jgi:predicted nicotinamide N-methyase